ELMYQKIAVAIIHGMGNQQEGYSKKTVSKIKKSFAKRMGYFVENPGDQLVIESILWAPIFEPKETELYDNTVGKNQLHLKKARRFIISYLGDAIAYQPVETVMQNYERVHDKIGRDLHELSQRVGAKAPLCVISHSLGAIIASNYFYDLQYKLQKIDCVVNRLSPLERGDTLTLFYTLGTTLPLWSLRYDDFTRPIHIPSSKLQDYYPNLHGEWINFYNRNDVLGFPLKTVNQSYATAVTEDREVKVGNLFTKWNPLSHRDYLTDKLVIDPVVEGLCRTWRNVNGVK